jgi:hypothetical protein
MLKFLSTVVIFVVAAPIVLAQPHPSSPIRKRVTFTLPAQWEIQNQEDSDAGAKINISIPYPETKKTTHSANVAIVANFALAGGSIKEVGDKVYSYPGLTVVADIPDGEEWRTIVWSMYSGGAPYVMLNRFGCANGITVDVLMSFPLLENGDPKWIEKAISDFNSLCESLRIDAKNSTEAKVNLGEIIDMPKSKAGPYVKIKLPEYLRPEHKPVLERWLKEKRYLRLATESDLTDKEDLGIWRKDWGKDFNPYYSIGDFNRDGKNDFAVLLIDLKNAQEHKFAIAIFNAPFANKKGPNYFEDGYIDLGRCYIVYNQMAKRRLYLGVSESDFYCVTFYPKGPRYYFRDCM